MLGDEGLKLVRELKRHQDTIGTFNNESMGNCQREIRHLYEEYEAILARCNNSNNNNQQDENKNGRGQEANVDPASYALLNVATTAIHRNIRCMMTYTHHRMLKLQSLAMHNRADGAGRKPPPKEYRADLSPQENTFYLEYCRLLHRYKVNFDDLVDITGDLTVPPTSVYVHVRALRDLDFETEDGRRKRLVKGHSDFLKRSNVEKYIEQGYLAHVV